MHTDPEVDELLKAAGERWRTVNQRAALVIDRSRLREGPPVLHLATLAQTAMAAALVVVVAAVAAFALVVRPPDQSAVGIASPSPIPTASLGPSTSDPPRSPAVTAVPSESPPTAPPISSPTAEPAWTPPTVDEQRARARRVLDDWAAFVADSPADMILVTEGMTTQDHGWSGPNGDNAKSALGSGVIESEVPVPDDLPPPVEVKWRDGSTTTVELLSAAAALDAIRSEGGGECRGCTPVHVVEIRLTTHEFDTVRGPTQLPVWEFTLREGNVHVFRVAAAHARVLHSREGVSIASVSAAQGSNKLTVKYQGGACTDPDRLRAHAVESNLAVVVFVTADPPATRDADATPRMCIAIGIMYTVTVELGEPLGSRTVLDISGTPTSRDASWLQPR